LELDDDDTGQVRYGLYLVGRQIIGYYHVQVLGDELYLDVVPQCFQCRDILLGRFSGIDDENRDVLGIQVTNIDIGLETRSVRLLNILVNGIIDAVLVLVEVEVVIPVVCWLLCLRNGNRHCGWNEKTEQERNQ
jgi:hypothetical protein